MTDKEKLIQDSYQLIFDRMYIFDDKERELCELALLTLREFALEGVIRDRDT